MPEKKEVRRKERNDKYLIIKLENAQESIVLRNLQWY
jgi:hypothetical protein